MSAAPSDPYLAGTPLLSGKRRPFLVLPVLALALTACGKKEPEKGGPPVDALPPYVVDVITVRPQLLEETLSATGTLVANEAIILQAERPGLVKEICFKEGQAMKAGEVLVLMDDSELQPLLERVVAQRRIAETLEKRQKELLKSRGISEFEYEQTEANVKVAVAEEALVRAQLAKTRLVAPFDGVAGLRRVSVGSYLTPGTTICTFQDIASLKLDFSLPERYLSYLRLDQQVKFRVTGSSEVHEAEIIAIEPTIDVKTRTMTVRASVPNRETSLLPGSFTEVTVTLEEIPGALMIPPIALIPGLKQQTVLVHQDGLVVERKVVAGLRKPDAVQILEGLSDGDEVITSGVLQVRAGTKVQVNRVETSPEVEPAESPAEATAPPPPLKVPVP